MHATLEASIEPTRGSTMASGRDSYQGEDFIGVDFSEARFRDVDFTGVKMTGAQLINANLSGLIHGLKINEVEVAPLIERELDRLHPERVKLRPTDPDGAREAWTVVEDLWREADARASRLTEANLQQRVDDEWSYVETLRHLIFVIDAWFSRTIRGEARPYHPLALPPTFITDLDDLHLDVDAKPTLAEVAQARADRMRRMREAVDSITADELARVCVQNPHAGYPPNTRHTVLECLHVVFSEEWDHHQYAMRDLDVVERAD
jgi:DinB superfamily/Pentapeptide repeats (8 copies)